MRTCLSLQIWEMQGYFGKMQGSAKCNRVKSHQSSIAWTVAPYSGIREAIIAEQGRAGRNVSAGSRIMDKIMDKIKRRRGSGRVSPVPMRDRDDEPKPCVLLLGRLSS